jgi:hypothetical protein
MTRIFFASDIHGSTLCFRRFLGAGDRYAADVLILGGDVTGKGLVPVRQMPDGTWRADFMGDETRLRREADIVEFEERLECVGRYSFRCSSQQWEELRGDKTQLEAIFTREAERRMREWVGIADAELAGKRQRVYFSAGNDDVFSIDPIIDESAQMSRPEGRVVWLNGAIPMISTGFANLTPFGCPRDVSEEMLTQRIERMASQLKDFSSCIFNLHCPPFGTALDQAWLLSSDLRPQVGVSGRERASVGSTAVRDAIARYQPLLGLHGHIHESRGVSQIGRTLCLNPGSEYEEGVLLGYVIDIVGADIQRYVATSDFD